MPQTRDEITENLTARLCWEVVRCDDTRIARRLYRKQVVDGRRLRREAPVIEYDTCAPWCDSAPYGTICCRLPHAAVSSFRRNPRSIPSLLPESERRTAAERGRSPSRPPAPSVLKRNSPRTPSMRGRHGVLTYGDATTSEVKRRGNIASMSSSGWSRLAGHGPLEEPEPVQSRQSLPRRLVG